MPVIPANIGPTAWPGGSFRPYGRVFTFGARTNPAQHLGKLWSARFMVGFNVGGRPRWKMKNIVDFVLAARAVRPDATFIATHGIYTSDEPPHVVVREKGAQVIILNTQGLDEQTFTDEMVALAEIICRQFRQEKVIVEIQYGGVIQDAISVTP